MLKVAARASAHDGRRTHPPWWLTGGVMLSACCREVARRQLWYSEQDSARLDLVDRRGGNTTFFPNQTNI